MAYPTGFGMVGSQPGGSGYDPYGNPTYVPGPNGGLPGVGANYVPGSNSTAGYATGGPGGGQIGSTYGGGGYATGGASGGVGGAYPGAPIVQSPATDALAQYQSQGGTQGGFGMVGSQPPPGSSFGADGVSPNYLPGPNGQLPGGSGWSLGGSQPPASSFGADGTSPNYLPGPNGGLPGVGANYIPGSNPQAGSLSGGSIGGFDGSQFGSTNPFGVANGLPGVGANYVPGGNPQAGSLQGGAIGQGGFGMVGSPVTGSGDAIGSQPTPYTGAPGTNPLLLAQRAQAQGWQDQRNANFQDHSALSAQNAAPRMSGADFATMTNAQNAGYTGGFAGVQGAGQNNYSGGSGFGGQLGDLSGGQTRVGNAGGQGVQYGGEYTGPQSGGGAAGQMVGALQGFLGGGPGATNADTNYGSQGARDAAMAGSGQGSFSGSSPNGYLGSMADEIGRRTQQGLGQAFNGIRSNAIGNGGFGGGRQGVAEGVATGQAMDSLQGNLAGLFGGQYNQDANRGLQRYQGDQNNSTQRYGLDQNYDINSQNARNNFYTQNRTLDQSGAQLGANLYSQGMQGEWNPINQANGVYNDYTGFGSTNTGQTGGSDWQRILGGLMAGGSFANQMGWGSGG